ncbi:Transcriptional regulator NovG [Streptomyces sp. enrichment culture]
MHTADAEKVSSAGQGSLAEAGPAPRGAEPASSVAAEVRRGLGGRVEEVAVGRLRPAASPRRCLDPGHVETLAALDDPYPPVVVHAATGQVIDGLHRLEAALRRGDRTIAVRYFDGGPDEAFVYAVHANTAHGLPLSLAERRTAALRILRSRPAWSDRRIAAVAGLSARVVAELRATRSPAGDRPAVRVGRDDRARPVDPRRGRELAARLLREQPDASLRTIAGQAGVSPGTVRDVRARLSRGEDPVPARQRGRRPAPVAAPAPLRSAEARKRPDDVTAEKHADFQAALRALRQDPSLRFTEVGRFLLRMLEPQVPLATQQQRILHSVPGHCAPLLSTAARAYADSLRRFADRLESEVAVTGPDEVSRAS